MEHRNHSFKAEDRTVHHRDTELHTCIVQQVTRGEVVSAVNYDVVARNDLHDVFSSKTSVVRDHLDIRVQQIDRLLCGINFAITDALDVVQNLALQIAGINIVHVHDANCSDTSGR